MTICERPASPTVTPQASRAKGSSAKGSSAKGSSAKAIPAGVIRVAESAVLDVTDVERYREAGADAILVGEALVKGDPIQTLSSFLSV